MRLRIVQQLTLPIPDVVELKCSVCGHNTAQVQHRFSRLPQALVLHVQRYAFSRSECGLGVVQVVTSCKVVRVGVSVYIAIRIQEEGQKIYVVLRKSYVVL